MSNDFSTARQTMIDEHLRARGITDERVLDAMRRVPREHFVEVEDAPLAYDDRALPIGCSQTISQPYVVALMTQALEVSPGQCVFEIGTGSGYQSAVLAGLGAEVFTIERHPSLAKNAAERLNLQASARVHVRIGDGSLGWPEEAPFDRAIITAATDEIPPAVWQQLAEGGLLVAPLGGRDQQTLEQVRKIGDRPHRQPLIEVRFVPLLPEIAASPPSPRT